MQILKIILLIIGIVLAGIAIRYYFKLRRLLNENEDVTVDDISEKIQPIIKKLSIISYALVAVGVIDVFLLIVEFVQKIFLSV